MDPGFSVALVFGTIFFFVYQIVRLGMKHSEEKLRIRHGARAVADPDPAVAAAHIEIAALKERVQVLERLATDDDRRLASEINRLRAEARS
jgi:hypothetical protein